MVPSPIFESERLQGFPVQLQDASFFEVLMNEPDFIRFIGDRKIDSLLAAQDYLKPRISEFEQTGFGVLVIRRKGDETPVGITSLLSRDEFPNPDIGYAFLREYRGHGYALEATEATVDYARTKLGLCELVAVCSGENERSIRLLEKLGMRFVGLIEQTSCCEEKSRMYSMTITKQSCD